MLRPRIIPCLLVHKKGLVKTKKFGEPKYVGDPLNAVRIFNEKKVDELIVLDIDASVAGHEPNFGMIEKLAEECRMPLCYGGGISSVDHARSILSLGVEKLAISASAVGCTELLREIVSEVGAQSVVLVLDVKKKAFRQSWDVYTHNAKKKSNRSLDELLEEATSIGVGEVVINSIDHDGCMKGYDKKLVEHVVRHINVPLTVLGGAGSLDDIRGLIEDHGIIGCAAGSLFVFQGKYRAVLINYPVTDIKESLFVRHPESKLA